MKYIYTLFFGLLFICTSKAQQPLIAIKGAVTDTIATTLQQAIDLAQPNDKIYLPGGTYTLTDSIQKPVHIIGTGYNHLIDRLLPISNFVGGILIGNQADGLILEGVRSNGAIMVRANDVTLRKVYAPTVNANKTNLLVIQSIFHGSNSVFGFNANISNCLINEASGSQSSDFINCVIGLFRINGQSTNHNSIVTNSILGVVWNCSISYNNNSVFNSSCVGYNTPDFMNCFNGYISFSDLNSDFSLSPSAPIQGIGIYHGNYPWKDGGQPINPHILENNSFLDIQSEEFKLRVIVVPQTN
ncbi:MAG: hypothetical protein LAT76_07750 [Schleiferiaceae bacterium]|nr:hypothetical protein [Schleiferiaceae bacterium]